MSTNTQLPGSLAKRQAGTPADSKAFSTLAARFAIAGWQLWRTDAADGPQRLFAARWGQVTRPLSDLAEAEQLLERIKGKAA